MRKKREAAWAKQSDFLKEIRTQGRVISKRKKQG
jgi:hypothetical protein